MYRFVVLAINSFVSSNYNGQDVSCYGSSDGEISIQAFGGTQPYQYSANAGVSFFTSGQPNTPILIVDIIISLIKAMKKLMFLKHI